MANPFRNICAYRSCIPNVIVGATLAVAVYPQSVQAAQPEGLETVVVTAQRRSQNLQQVPIAVTAISGATLAAQGTTNVPELSNAVPGLTIQQAEGFALPHIRGIGNSAVGPGIENSVAVYVDGVYVASAPASVLSLNDVKRVEVLKGPQGTLFGRNATGGLIQIITREPSDTFEGNFDAGYGSYDSKNLKLYLSGPLDERVSANLAVEASRQGDGWGRNITLHKDVYTEDLNLSARSKWLVSLGDNTKLTLSFDYQHRRSNLDTTLGNDPGTPDYYYGIRKPVGGRYDVALDTQPQSLLDGGGASIRLEHDFGKFHVLSISAYRDSRYKVAADFDLGPAPINFGGFVERDKEITQELQLQGKVPAWLNWTAGLYYISTRSSYAPLQLNFNGPAINPLFPLTEVTNFATQKMDSIAGYGQATASLSDDTRITLGLRYTRENRHFDANETGVIYYAAPVTLAKFSGHSLSVTRTTWRAALDHDLSDTAMAYFSFSTGFKSGGFNPGNPNALPYRPETLTAYEIGAKTEWLDHRLRANASVFHYDYADIQVSRYINGVAEIYNGAAARVDGLDLDLEFAITNHLTLRGGAEFLDQRFTKFPAADYLVNCPTLPFQACSRSAKGNMLPQTPDVSLVLGVQYHTVLAGGDTVFSLSDAYKSKFYYDPSNTYAQPAFHLINGSVQWTSPSGRYNLMLWAKNIGDQKYTTNIGSALNAIGIAYGAPRVVGVSAGIAF